MTNSGKTPSKKMPGDTLIGFGASIGILAVIVFAISAVNGGSAAGIAILMLLLAFGLAVIGYLQRIAAKR